MYIPGRIEHSVTCLAADMCLSADPGVASLIPARSHTLVKIDHEIISTVILLPSADSRRVIVSDKQKYADKVLAGLLAKPLLAYNFVLNLYNFILLMKPINNLYFP